MWQASSNQSNMSVQAFQGVQQLVTAHRELQQRFLALEQKVFTMEGTTGDSSVNSGDKSENVDSNTVVQKVVLDYTTWTTFWEGLDDSQKSNLQTCESNKRLEL